MEREIDKAIARAQGVNNHSAPEANAGLPEICCGRCKHYVARVQLGAMNRVCIAHPPKMYAVPNGNNLTFTSMQPPVDERETCGEFSRRPDG